MTQLWRSVTHLHVVFLTDDFSGAPPPPERAVELKGIHRHPPIHLQVHKPETQVIVCAALQRRHTEVLLRMQSCDTSEHRNCRKIYLAVDVTGQEGGAKHQVSNIIDQDSVTTECGLLIGQEVDSILVWWFTAKCHQHVRKREREPEHFHPLRTSLAPIFSSRIKKRTFKVKADHRAKEAGPDRKPEVTLETFGLKRS